MPLADRKSQTLRRLFSVSIFSAIYQRWCIDDCRRLSHSSGTPSMGVEEDGVKSHIWTLSIAAATVLALSIGITAQDDPGSQHKHRKYWLIDLGTFGTERGRLCQQFGN